MGLSNTLELERNFLNLERYIRKANNLLFSVTWQKLACTLHLLLHEANFKKLFVSYHPHRKKKCTRGSR